ncbi:MAG: hypothetical protein HC797_08540, partial [Anaerolineales bacterium]|nr:hypothetical protein [Anaerolineales bacterium]
MRTRIRTIRTIRTTTPSHQQGDQRHQQELATTPATGNSNSSASTNNSTPRIPVTFANDRPWYEGDVTHNINGPTTAKHWKMIDQWTGDEYTLNCDLGNSRNEFRHSEYDCFMACFPKDQLTFMVNKLNGNLLQKNKERTTIGELLKWFGVMLLTTRFEFGERSSLWSETPPSKYIPAPAFGRTGMSRQRFEDLWSA